MTTKQALKKAQQRWGKTAYVERRKVMATGGDTFSIGRVVMDLFFEVLGSGDSWEEAFAAADKWSAQFKPE